MIDRMTTEVANTLDENRTALIQEAERFLEDVCDSTLPSAETAQRRRLSNNQKKRACYLASVLGKQGKGQIRANDAKGMRLLTDLRHRLLLLAEGEGYWSERKVIATMEDEITCPSILISSMCLVQSRLWRIFNENVELNKVSTGVHLNVQLLNGHWPIASRIQQGWMGKEKDFRYYYQQSFPNEPWKVNSHVEARKWDYSEIHDYGNEECPKERKSIPLSLIALARSSIPSVWGFCPQGSFTKRKIQKKRNRIQSDVLAFLTKRCGFSKCLLKDL